MSVITLLPSEHHQTGTNQHAIYYQCQSHQGTVLNLEVLSKNQLSIQFPDDFLQLACGTSIQDLILTVQDQEFRLPNLEIKQKLNTDQGLDYVLHSDNCIVTTQKLWELDYKLKSTSSQTTTLPWDEYSLPKIPARGLYTEEARQERLAFIKTDIGKEVTEVEHTRLNPRKLVSNIEGFIGSVELPVGLAGPLHIQGRHANGLYYAPMATSEGALVASATRGATALSRSGGVNARVLRQRMMRVPLFSFDDMDTALRFAKWAKDHQQELSQEIHKYSNFAQLVELDPQVMGRDVHLHFIYQTGDAAGQNMTTTCTWQACQWIFKRLKQSDQLSVRYFLIDANLSNDKKVTYQNFLKGRGIQVMAEAILTDAVCRRVLKVSAVQLVTAYQKMVTGALAAGMVGLNINVANVIGAMFTALGQDIACVHESSLAQLHMEINDEGNVYCTLTLPSLVIGTVGGGTNLPQQRECLDILGCAGSGHAHKLAEIIVSYCLALDISTLSAIAADHFARAHEKLGRNRPVDFLKLGDFTPELFNTAIQKMGIDNLTIDGVLQTPHEIGGSSIITELTSHKVSKLLGHFPFCLTGSETEYNVMVKVKPLDDEVIMMLDGMAAMCGDELAREFHTFRNQIGFKGCHVKELAVMTQQDDRFVHHTPLVYGTLLDPEREAYVIIEELLDDLELMDSANDTSGWQTEHLIAAITGIAQVHSIWYRQEDALLEQTWMTDYPTAQNMLEKQSLWRLLIEHAESEFPQWITSEETAILNNIVDNIETWWQDIDAMPKTLIHNDFNPRNIAFRRHEQELTLCAYDWELATLHLPQRDLVELLAFTLQGDVTKEQVDYYIDTHRNALEESTGEPIDATQWRQGYVLSLLDFSINRLLMYLMAHTFRDYAFMKRIYRTVHQLIKLEEMPA